MSHYPTILAHYIRKVLILLLLTVHTAWAADTAGFDKGLLWEVSRDGQLQGYVLGTIHSEDPRVLKTAQEMTAYLNKVKGLAIEVEMAEDTMMAAQTAMLLPGNDSLQGIIGDELFNKVAALAMKYGIPEPALQRMQPWAIALTLSMPVPKGGMPLDLKLFADAQTGGKHVSGLETALEQLSVFTNLSRQDQVLMLSETVKYYDRVLEFTAAMHEIWLDRNLRRMMEINEEMLSMGDQSLNDRFIKALVDDRNVRMVERAIKLFKQRTTFVAVGSLHLPGKNGVLAGLRDKGYTVKAVW